MVVNVRSSLSAGLAAAVVAAGAGFAAVSPVASAPMPMIASPAVQLSALASALPKPAAALPTKPTTNPFGGGTGATPGERIINSYNAIQPWVQYGVELSAWTVGWLPWPIGLISPQLNIGYSGVEPISRALVYSVAYAIDGQFDLIQPTIKNGIQTGINNLVQGEIGWILGFFPPLPPIKGAAVTAPRVTSRAAASLGVKPAATVKTVAAEVSAPVSDPADPAPVTTVASVAPVRPARAHRVLPAPAAAVDVEAAAGANPQRNPAARAKPSTRSAAKGTPRGAAGVKAARGR